MQTLKMDVSQLLVFFLYTNQNNLHHLLNQFQEADKNHFVKSQTGSKWFFLLKTDAWKYSIAGKETLGDKASAVWIPKRRGCQENTIICLITTDLL